MTEIIISRFDIAPTWHKEYPDILTRFAEEFREPLVVCGCGERCQLGVVERVEARGNELHGDVRWLGEPPAGFVHMSWGFGPGGLVSLSSGYVDLWPHQQDVYWIEEDEEW